MLGIDITYSLRGNALSAKSVLGGRVALTLCSEAVHHCHSHCHQNLIEVFAFFMYGYQEAVLQIG